jgi:outer membrane lipoprotein SlyB
MSNKIIQEGKDALSRSLLLMNYSNKQTLSENVEKVSKIEEQSWSQITKGAATGAATGAAVGATALGAGAIPGAIIGALGGAVLAAIGNPKMDQVKKMFDACKTEKSTPTLTTSQLDAISDSINDAIQGVGTDEDAISSALQQLPTIPDLCGLIKAYEYHGDLFSDLDGDLDSDYEWKQYVVIPLRNAIRKSQEITNNAGQKNTGSGKEKIDW